MNKDIALLLLRLAGVGLALNHGWGKISSLATGGGEGLISGVEALGFPMPGLFAWAAALAEFAGGILVALGLGTRIAASFAAFTMFVAALGRHRFHLHILVALGLLDAAPEEVKRWGNPEMSLIYLVCLVAVVLMGGGRFSLDHLLKRKRS
jgi:putative oxidoreductase